MTANTVRPVDMVDTLELRGAALVRGGGEA